MEVLDVGHGSAFCFEDWVVEWRNWEHCRRVSCKKNCVWMRGFFWEGTSCCRVQNVNFRGKVGHPSVHLSVVQFKLPNAENFRKTGVG